MGYYCGRSGTITIGSGEPIPLRQWSIEIKTQGHPGEWVKGRRVDLKTLCLLLDQIYTHHTADKPKTLWRRVWDRVTFWWKK